MCVEWSEGVGGASMGAVDNVCVRVVSRNEEDKHFHDALTMADDSGDNNKRTVARPVTHI